MTDWGHTRQPSLSHTRYCGEGEGPPSILYGHRTLSSNSHEPHIAAVPDSVVHWIWQTSLFTATQSQPWAADNTSEIRVIETKWDECLLKSTQREPDVFVTKSHVSIHQALVNSRETAYNQKMKLHFRNITFSCNCEGIVSLDVLSGGKMFSI